MTSSPTPIQKKIINERMILLLENGKKSNISLFVLALAIIGIFHNEIPSVYLTTWFVSIIGFIFVRREIIKRKNTCKSLQSCRFYYGLTTFILSLLLASVNWLPGATSDIVNIAILIVLGAGIVSAGIIILAMDRIIQLLYILPFPLFLAIRIITLENKEAMPLSYLIVIFILAMIVFGKQAADSLTKNLSLRFENELLALNMEKARAQALKSKLQAEKANQSKSFFLANMSHEIRTPMNAIIGLTNMVKKTNTTPQQQYLINNVQKASISLLGLLDDILDISKIEAGELSIEQSPFYLSEILTELMDKMQVFADKKSIKLILNKRIDNNFKLMTDQVRLYQVMLNLVNNAIKFTNEGEVKIKITTQLLDNNKILLYFGVKDTGIGIVTDKIKAIFNSFNQADVSFVRKYGGSGLGLTISDHLIDLMGGMLLVNSIEHQGSHFYFKIQLPYEKTKTKTLQKKSFIIKRPLTILLVEDDQINRFLAESLLQSEGHQVISVENGLESLVYLAKKSVDLVLMDIQMPVMDGYTATKIIRISEEQHYNGDTIEQNLAAKLHDSLKNKHLPIFALTAHAMAEDRKKCFEAGVDQYLTKPFDHEKIINTINTVISK